MRTVLRRRTWAETAAVVCRKAKRSERVAEYVWNTSCVFLMIAAMGESVVAVGAALCFLAAATMHRRSVERINGKKDETDL